jgi:hypothetical protein
MIRIADYLLGKHAMAILGNRQRERFMLWVDSVGGYRVCLDDEVTLGQPDRQAPADVPILGDLSSRHARIRRDDEGYLIEALKEVGVDDHRIGNVGWLREGSRIQLGPTVLLLFRRPHPLSATARLDFLSHHRTQPSADAVLLMAETCVLGPKRHAHVVCPTWTREVILYRRGQSFYCRTAGEFEIDGVTCNGSGPISKNSHVEGSGFSFNLEGIE